MPTKKALSSATAKNVEHHLELALIYFEDGAAHSAMCHVVAAQRALKGMPIPKGPKFWGLLKQGLR